MEKETISYEIVGGVVVIMSEEDIDEAVSWMFQEVTKGLIRDGHIKLVLDLSKVSYLASSCLGLIAAATDSLSSQGGTICFCNVNAEVRRILQTVKLDGIIDVYGSCEDAVAALSA